MAEGFYAWDNLGTRHCLGLCRSDPAGSAAATSGGNYGPIRRIASGNQDYDGCRLPQPACAVCDGDCDTDAECAGDLECLQRGSQATPGCTGTGMPGYDFCYRVGGYPTTPGASWGLNPSRTPDGRLAGINYD